MCAKTFVSPNETKIIHLNGWTQVSPNGGHIYHYGQINIRLHKRRSYIYQHGQTSQCMYLLLAGCYLVLLPPHTFLVGPSRLLHQACPALQPSCSCLLLPLLDIGPITIAKEKAASVEAQCRTKWVRRYTKTTPYFPPAELLPCKK